MTQEQTEQLHEQISEAFNNEPLLIISAYKRLTAILYACQQELSFSEVEAVVNEMEEALANAIQHKKQHSND